MSVLAPPPVGVPLRPHIPGGVVAPSAAAAAGAAAAALLQRQLAQDGAGGGSGAPNGGWTEHQTGDGRKFYFHEETQMSTWEKPEVLMTPEERANDTKWGEYRIWDGRVFYHNKETKVSCWRMPPELRKMREGISGIDDRPLALTMAEKRRAFLDVLKERGVNASWAWEAVDSATAEEPQAEVLTEHMRKQCFGEILSLAMRQQKIEEREKQRNAANALERLIEERFARPEDVGTTYEEAARLFEDEEPWQLIKSDVRRYEVFQNVMERLEDKHKKARAEKRSERVVRLQRFIASDPELKRARLRWKDAVAILAKRDELQEEDPPLEALRVWASLRDLKQATEHEAEAKAKQKEDPVAAREDRKRRDAFLQCLKELAQRGVFSAETSWLELQAVTENEARVTAMREGRGATAMELFDEFQEDMRMGRIQGLAMITGGTKDDLNEKQEQVFQPPAKRQRISRLDPEDDGPPAAAVAAAQAAAAAVAARQQEAAAAEQPMDAQPAEEDVSALDALIMAAAEAEPTSAVPAEAPKGTQEDDDNSEDSDSDEEEEDPLMGVVNAATAARAAQAQAAVAEASGEAQEEDDESDSEAEEKAEDGGKADQSDDDDASGEVSEASAEPDEAAA